MWGQEIANAVSWSNRHFGLSISKSIEHCVLDVGSRIPVWKVDLERQCSNITFFSSSVPIMLQSAPAWNVTFCTCTVVCTYSWGYSYAQQAVPCPNHFSHSIVLTMEQQGEHVITQYRTHRKIAITSCHLTGTSFPSWTVSLFLLKYHPYKDKLLVVLFGSNKGFWFVTAWKYCSHVLMIQPKCSRMMAVSSVGSHWWRDEALVKLHTQPLWFEAPWKTHSLQVTSCQKKGGSTRLQ